MAAGPSQPVSSATTHPSEVAGRQELRVYAHSGLLYLWPLWLFGFVTAGVTAAFPEKVPLSGDLVWFCQYKALGLTYVVVVFLTILFTNMSVRGAWSLVVIITIAFEGSRPTMKLTSHETST